MTASYAAGPNEPPLLDVTIGAALDAAAQSWPLADALICPAQGVRLTWDQLHEAAEAFAAGLLAKGMTSGDRIGVWGLNRAEWTITQFAAAKAGLILVSLNPSYGRTELEFVINKVGCKAVVIAPAFKTTDYAGMLASLGPSRLPTLQLIIEMEGGALAGSERFEAVLQAGRAAGTTRLHAVEATLSPTDPINIQFTSGTTGSPKGVTLSHRSIINNGSMVGLCLELTSNDRICVPVPLYHCFGMVMANLAAVTLGCALIYPGEGFDPFSTLRAIAQERCTALYGVPTMFLAQLDHPQFETFDLTCLRTGIMAGSACPEDVMRRVIERMHMDEITICYGMTETSPVSMQTLARDTFERRVSTVGRAHPHVEVKVVDPQGDVASCGQPGELCVRGYLTMLGYWDEPEQTESVLDVDGWLHSGDLATIDSDGYGRIVGRIKDMVIRGGENLYPREIEEFLYRHPGVSDVQVFGVPDAFYGEELCAWIIPMSGAEIDEASVRTFCSGEIARHKIPRHIRFVDAFPMTVSGKVRKIDMRAQMTAELNGL